MTLPYRYELLISVEILGDGIDASGDGAKATADRLAALLETDSHVTRASAWPGIEYKGKHYESPLSPQDGEERVEPWGATLRYHAEDNIWLVKGEARTDPFDDNNTFVRFDQRTDQPPADDYRVWICDALGGHEGAVDYQIWTSWPLVEDYPAKATEGESA
jgi:hypothetical protein